MTNIDEIIEGIDQRLDATNQAREAVLALSRHIVQKASAVIRAAHRHEWEVAATTLDEATALVAQMRQQTEAQQELFWAGYTQDALKEYAEAHLTLALIREGPLPTPRAILVEEAAYLNGLAEAASELRRHILDLVRRDDYAQAGRLLNVMEEIYSRLITIDYPHAITQNLRRTTDQLRGVLERTRGDLTLTMKQHELQHALAQFEARATEKRNG
ncbi:MAG: haloacid dehalogenase [Anaerolineales bacterium]|nr:haloacid dehalogenase [Anaerolineales bacterium]MCB9127259.1 haloacid dehalogenase [Ardenticatenales bacterium]